MRIRLRTSSTFACTSSSGAEYTATDPSRRRPVSVSRKKSGSATSTIRPSRPDSVAREARPLWSAAATAGNSRSRMSAFAFESDFTNGCAPKLPRLTPSSVTRALVSSAAWRTRRSTSATGALESIARAIGGVVRRAARSSRSLRSSTRLDRRFGTTPT